MLIDSRPIEPGKEAYSIGPVLPAETLKPPFRPQIAGRMAFFFGPLAGALLSVINLRRFGYPLKAKRVLLWTIPASVVLAVVLIVTPDPLGRFVGLAAEFAFYKVYASLPQREPDDWQAAHPTVEPLNGWKAIGWGFAGFILLFGLFFAVFLF